MKKAFSKDNNQIVPVLNPNWQDALDKAMHTSLMSRHINPHVETTAAPAPSSSSESERGGEEEEEEDENSGSESEDVSDMETPPDDFPPDDDGSDKDGSQAEEASEEEEEDNDTASTPLPSKPHRPRPPPRLAPAPRSTRPSVKSATAGLGSGPAPFSMGHKPVIHAPRNSSVEATRRRMEENLKLQREEKLDLLGKLQFYTDEKGFKPFRALGPDDSLEDIRYEVFRANREMSKKRNVKMMQKALVTVGAGIEFMNSWYNPLNLRLDGFSKSLLLTIREYDEIFDELHWKYCNSVAMPVEMKLVMTLGSSLWFFHMSNGAVPSHPNSQTHPPAPSPDLRRAPPPPPPPPPPSHPPSAPEPPPQQRRMNGPRMNPSTSDIGAPSPAGLDIGTLLGGLGMVQQLMR